MYIRRYSQGGYNLFGTASLSSCLVLPPRGHSLHRPNVYGIEYSYWENNNLSFNH